MENNLFYHSYRYTLHKQWLLPAVLLAAFLGWLIAKQGMTIGAILLLLPFILGFLILVFMKPKAGFVFFIIYCFAVPGLGRHIPGPQFGLGQDGLLILTWLGVIFYRTERFRGRHLNNDLVWLAIVWMIITLLELGNLEEPSFLGWVYEMRSITLYWVLSVPLAFLVFNKRSDIGFFLYMVIFISLVGAFYAIKQIYLGLDLAEKRWLGEGAARTHILFGKLRAFSFYTEAGQFGASQAQLSIMCFILAIGPHGFLKKIFYLLAGVIIFYGMALSGTRGALMAFVTGGFVFLVLSKKVKILIAGSLVGLGFLGILKYTNIGSSNYQVVRLRSALDPNDASFQVRLINQKLMKDYLVDKPFGVGVGASGQWGEKYNADKFISLVPPDSLFVKIWVMYGVVGLIVWLGIMLFITGKCAGIIWKTRDPVLKNQLSALCGGAAGILLCSYGNEVMNQMPSSIIVYTSWVLIWLSPRWDTPLPVQKIIE